MPARAKPPVLAEHEFQQLQTLLEDASGIVLAADRRTQVASRLVPRLHRHQLDNFPDYLQRLRQPAFAAEQTRVIDLLLSKETYFFREHRHFEFLAQWLLRNPSAKRFWSAACASGEEAYSLAMVASEHARSDDWSVLASDLSRASLGQLDDAVYDITQARYFPEGWLPRYSRCGTDEMDGRLRIHSSLRARVQARQINLAQALSDNLPCFDAIFLRNLLMYFCPHARQQMVRRVLAHLRPGGLLVIGHTESIDAPALPLRPILPSVFERL
ncbi:protein-glutamate O-methyltransferase CheR [Pseudomonas sp. TNT2022 ID681]|uniref:protein-glutamate O-methyltransferase n=2 Tax=Pseudomonas fontis TaxID=2942633 RepID=A0ABT5NZG4_9PSED|nr:protein-glutamate O-methyltransferase CheR [Pseudomonas fontis]MDD0976747.1 protein-glutamate O-methyltransferase CheR [Pseudomonas fontis]MDD0993512.1 protein-glutamate O-methyltransferase CheR [Pseudomonas fontis]